MWFKSIVLGVTLSLSSALAVGEQAVRPAVPAAGGLSGTAQESMSIPSGSKVFLVPMDNGFNYELRAAVAKKNVPIAIVDQKEGADFEISATSDTQKAGVAKILLMGSWHSREEASMRVTNLKSGVVVFAYSYHNDNSAHGKRSAAESCAKHLKEKIEEQK